MKPLRDDPNGYMDCLIWSADEKIMAIQKSPAGKIQRDQLHKPRYTPSLTGPVRWFDRFMMVKSRLSSIIEFMFI
jgi:hypothetical protein